MRTERFGECVDLGGDQMVRDDMTEAIEPEGRNLSEDYPFIGDTVGKNYVKCGQPVGRNYEEMTVEIVDIPYFPLPPGNETVNGRCANYL
jgi:hypothetical protein